MSRPLLISDCDEVLLHMVAHFADWIGEAFGYDFLLEEPGFANAVRERETGKPVPQHRIWSLLDAFFDSEMHRQNVVPGAVEALAEIAKVADVVILTNIGDEYQASRVEQLEAVNIRHRVLCNRGGKGRPVRELIDQLRPSATVFVDDLAIHHESVAEHAPEVWRLHMVADTRLAVHLAAAPDAHARVDRWEEAAPWIIEHLAKGPAPARPAA